MDRCDKPEATGRYQYRKDDSFHYIFDVEADSREAWIQSDVCLDAKALNDLH